MMSKRLETKFDRDAVFKEPKAKISDVDKEKVQALSADIETDNNKKLVMRCLMIAAVFMALLQSGQIKHYLEQFSPNLFSDTAKVVSREWHETMENIGLAGVKNRMTNKIHNAFPELTPKYRPNSVKIVTIDGMNITLRGASEIRRTPRELLLVEQEERAQTTFGKYKFRGSF